MRFFFMIFHGLNLYILSLIISVFSIFSARLQADFRLQLIFRLSSSLQVSVGYYFSVSSNKSLFSKDSLSPILKKKEIDGPLERRRRLERRDKPTRFSCFTTRRINLTSLLCNWPWVDLKLTSGDSQITKSFLISGKNDGFQNVLFGKLGIRSIYES